MQPGTQSQGPWLEDWIAGHDDAESSRASELDRETPFGQKKPGRVPSGVNHRPEPSWTGAESLKD